MRLWIAALLSAFLALPAAAMGQPTQSNLCNYPPPSYPLTGSECFPINQTNPGSQYPATKVMTLQQIAAYVNNMSVAGPGSSTIGDLAVWASTTGNLLADVHNLPIANLPSIFTASATCIGFSACSTGFGLNNSPFIINFAPTSEANSEALQVYRMDTWTGGTGVTGDARFYMTAPAGRTAYSWVGIFTLNNNSTAADAAQNVALYGQAFKNASGATWAGTLEMTDTSGVANPVAGSLGLEIDEMANGGDSNRQRFAIESFIGDYMSGASVQAAGAYRVASQNASNAQWATGLVCEPGAVVSGVAADGCMATGSEVGIDLGMDRGGKQIVYHNATQQWDFVDYATGTPIIDFSIKAGSTGSNAPGGQLAPRGMTYGQLTACTSASYGQSAFITDATASESSFDAVTTGGGSTKTWVVCNPSGWTVH